MSEQKGLCGRIVEGAINTRGLQLQRARVLHETLFVPVLLYDSETMIWSEKERSRIRVVQKYNLGSLLALRRMDKY